MIKNKRFKTILRLFLLTAVVLFSAHTPVKGQGEVTLKNNGAVYSVTSRGGGNVIVSWDAYSSATGYIVKWRNAKDANYTDSTFVTGGTCTIMGLCDDINSIVTGTTYYWMVSAIKDGKVIANSSQGSFRLETEEIMAGWNFQYQTNNTLAGHIDPLVTGQWTLEDLGKKVGPGHLNDDDFGKKRTIASNATAKNSKWGFNFTKGTTMLISTYDEAGNLVNGESLSESGILNFQGTLRGNWPAGAEYEFSYAGTNHCQYVQLSTETRIKDDGHWDHKNVLGIPVYYWVPNWVTYHPYPDKIYFDFTANDVKDWYQIRCEIAAASTITGENALGLDKLGGIHASGWKRIGKQAFNSEIDLQKDDHWYVRDGHLLPGFSNGFLGKANFWGTRNVGYTENTRNEVIEKDIAFRFKVWTDYKLGKMFVYIDNYYMFGRHHSFFVHANSNNLTYGYTEIHNQSTGDMRGVFFPNEKARLVAVEQPNGKFVGWYQNNHLVSKDKELIFNTTQDLKYEARFVENICAPVGFDATVAEKRGYGIENGYTWPLTYGDNGCGGYNVSAENSCNEQAYLEHKIGKINAVGEITWISDWSEGTAVVKDAGTYVVMARTVDRTDPTNTKEIEDTVTIQPRPIILTVDAARCGMKGVFRVNLATDDGITTWKHTKEDVWDGKIVNKGQPGLRCEDAFTGGRFYIRATDSMQYIYNTIKNYELSTIDGNDTMFKTNTSLTWQEPIKLNKPQNYIITDTLVVLQNYCGFDPCTGSDCPKADVQDTVKVYDGKCIQPTITYKSPMGTAPKVVYRDTKDQGAFHESLKCYKNVKVEGDKVEFLFLHPIYGESSLTRILKITPKEVKIVVDPKQLAICNGADPVYKWEAIGLVSTDSINCISGTPEIKDNAPDPTTVGEYLVEVDVSGMSAQNYTFKGENATLKVLSNCDTIIFDADAIAYSKEKEYDGTPLVSDTVTAHVPSGLSVEIYYKVDGGAESTTLPQRTNVGTSNIKAIAYAPNKATATITNQIEYTLKVTPATLRVTARDVNFGECNAPATWTGCNDTITGFKNGENESVITGEPDCKVEPAYHQAVGEYKLIPLINGLSAQNYIFKADTATLAVYENTPIVFCASCAAGDPILPVSDTRKTYDGTKLQPAVVIDNVIVEYSTNPDNPSSWTEDIPYLINVDTLDVYVRAYNDNTPECIQTYGGTYPKVAYTLIIDRLGIDAYLCGKDSSANANGSTIELCGLDTIIIKKDSSRTKYNIENIVYNGSAEDDCATGSEGSDEGQDYYSERVLSNYANIDNNYAVTFKEPTAEMEKDFQNHLLITQNLVIIRPPKINDASCEGYNDGSAEIRFAGGRAPFSYTVTGDRLNEIASGTISLGEEKKIILNDLYADKYLVTVKDAKDSIDTMSFTISETPSLSHAIDDDLITFPEDTMIFLDYNVCDTLITLPEPVINFPGADTLFTITKSVPDGYRFGYDTTEVTWTIFDECGTEISRVQNVVVFYPKCEDSVLYNGHKYPVVRIGCDCWLAENLRNTEDANGNPIAVAKQYEDKDSLGNIYGRLYTWHSAVGVEEGNNYDAPTTDANGYVQGICPDNWTIPSSMDMMTLAMNPSEALKSMNQNYWLPGFAGTEPNTGFESRGAGIYQNNVYKNIMGEVLYWTDGLDEITTPTTAMAGQISYYCERLPFLQMDKSIAVSVRCIKKYKSAADIESEQQTIQDIKQAKADAEAEARAKEEAEREEQGLTD